MSVGFSFLESSSTAPTMQPTIASIVQLLMSALVAGCTVGGKAFGKSIAMNNATAIIHTAAKLIYFFKSIPRFIVRMFKRA